MNLTKKQIHESSAMQLAIRLTRLQFDDELDAIDVNDKKEIIAIETELKERLIKMLGHDFYPPDQMEATETKKIKPKAKLGSKIKFNVTITSSLGIKAAEFSVETDSKLEADKLARKQIRKLGLQGASYKIS